MKIFAIGDTHLSFKESPDLDDLGDGQLYKPMGVFGPAWANHCRRLYEAWQDIVSPEDLVLIPGDFSWALRLEDIGFDLEFMARLKGEKVLIQGNHDYWWQSPRKIRQYFPPNLKIIQNDSLRYGDLSLTGTRLWTVPGSGEWTAQDEKIYARELIRQELTLKAAETDWIINLNHFMPVNEKAEENEVIALLRAYGVRTSLYGHLHFASHALAVEGEHWGIDLALVSGDYLDFVPRLIAEA